MIVFRRDLQGELPFCISPDWIAPPKVRTGKTLRGCFEVLNKVSLEFMPTQKASSIAPGSPLVQIGPIQWTLAAGRNRRHKISITRRCLRVYLSPSVVNPIKQVDARKTSETDHAYQLMFFRSRKNPPVGPASGSVANQIAVSAPSSGDRFAPAPPIRVRTQPGHMASFKRALNIGRPRGHQRDVRPAWAKISSDCWQRVPPQVRAGSHFPVVHADSRA